MQGSTSMWCASEGDQTSEVDRETGDAPDSVSKKVYKISSHISLSSCLSFSAYCPPQQACLKNVECAFHRLPPTPTTPPLRSEALM